MPVLINPENQQAQDLAPDAAQSALQQGWHVPLVDSEGNAFSAPHEEATRLVQAGTHAQPNQNQLQYLLDQTDQQSPTQTALAALEGASESLTGPLYKSIAPKLGLTTAENIRKREEYHPVAETLGGIGGAVFAPEASFAGMAGKVGKAVEGLSGAGKLGTVLGWGLRGSSEGALFGASHEVSEAMLGDPAPNAESVLGTIGLSAILGGGASIALSPLAIGMTKLLHGRAATEGIASGSQHEAGVAPKSMGEMQDMLNNAPSSILTDAPAKVRLQEAEDIIANSQFPSQFNTHELQMRSLDSPEARMEYKTRLEGGGQDAQTMRDYEASMKRESLNLLGKTVENTAPGYNKTADPVEGGQRFISTVENQYQTEKEALKPLFKQFDAAAINPVSGASDLMAQLEKSVPGVSKFIDADVNGKVKFEKYSPTMPFSKNAHGVIRDLVNAANDGDLTLGGLRNLRETMRDNLNLLSPPRDWQQIGSIRKGLLDYLEGEVGKLDPNINVRDTFKRYAINEQNREILESIMGGKIGQNATFAKTIKPENVLDRVFKDTVSVNAAKNILGGDFNKSAADYLASQMDKVTDPAKNGFSSNKFSTFLRGKTPELNAGLGPDSVKLMSAFTDKMRILPDSPPGNPSHTADKVVAILKNANKLREFLTPSGLLAKGIEKTFGSFIEAKDRAIADAILAGKSTEQAEAMARQKVFSYGLLSRIEDYKSKALNSIARSANTIFRIGTDAPGAAGMGLGNIINPRKTNSKEDQALSNEPIKVNKLGTLVQNHSQNPQGLIDHMDQATGSLAQYAPNTASAISTSVGRGVSFLASKAPKMDQKLAPLDKAIQPSNVEIAKFNRYAEIVEDPFSVLSHIKTGTILPQDIETLSQVYPQMYGQMREAVTNKMIGFLTKNEGHEIPYKTKLGLSMFLGQNLDSTMVPQNILHNQLAMATSPQQQGMPQAQQTKPSKTGMQKMHFLSQDQTAAQLAASRRGKA